MEKFALSSSRNFLFGRCRWLVCLILLRTRRKEALSALVNSLLSSLFHTIFCVTTEPVLKLQAQNLICGSCVNGDRLLVRKRTGEERHNTIFAVDRNLPPWRHLCLLHPYTLHLVASSDKSISIRFRKSLNPVFGACSYRNLHFQKLESELRRKGSNGLFSH